MAKRVDRLTESDNKISHNMSLWKYYPLGMVMMMFTTLDQLLSYLPQERKAIDKLGDALEEFDSHIRSKYFPMPKKSTRANR